MGMILPCLRDWGTYLHSMRRLNNWVRWEMRFTHVIKWPHARDNGMMGLVNGRTKGWYSELCKGRAQNAIVCKFCFCSTEEVGKMYYSVRWLLKIVSTSRDIALEVDQLWLPHLQKLPVCIVRKVVLRSHPMENQHTSRKTHTYSSDSLRPLLRPLPGTSKGA